MIDAQEKELIRQLVLNPRISDNQISKNTNIPLKSVNRKRKRLEEEGLLNYYCYLDTSSTGTGDFGARQMYVIHFKTGITRYLFNKNMTDSSNLFSKHVLESHIGEKDGRLLMIVIIESRLASDILEIFNAEIMPALDKALGPDSVHEVQSFELTAMTRILHNYQPRQMKKGYLDGSSKDSLFITDQV